MRTMQRSERGFTLVELLVVIAIIGILVALLLPAVQAAREAARRNQCLNNVKQLALALHNHHDVNNSFPLVSTRPWSTVDNNGSTNTAATIYSDDDGYSWLVKLLPFMEQTPLYDRITKETNRFSANAFANTNTLSGNANAADEVAFWEVEMPDLMCPSFDGDPVANQAVNALGDTGATNYVSLAATHFTGGQSSPTGVATGSPSSNAPSGQNGCQNAGAYCGNGVLAFPGATSQDTITRRGFAFRSMTDGSSKTTVFAESRDQDWNSWYSGLSGYVVGTWPSRKDFTAFPVAATNGNGEGPDGTWTFANNGGAGAMSLNQGARRTNESELFYIETAGEFPHGNNEKKWGPSSLHSGGVVLHGFGDGHAKPIADNIAGDVYLHYITRNGREPISDEN